MKQARILLLLSALMVATTALGQGAQNTAAQPPPSIASVVDRQIASIEKQLLDVAEAMPDTSSISLPKDCIFPAPITKMDSFALGHRAAATLTTENLLRTPEHSKSTRLSRAIFDVTHASDHYGQMVEYLRMNGIVPPASRNKSD
jgi:hypothetical protein